MLWHCPTCDAEREAKERQVCFECLEWMRPVKRAFWLETDSIPFELRALDRLMRERPCIR